VIRRVRRWWRDRRVPRICEIHVVDIDVVKRLGAFEVVRTYTYDETLRVCGIYFINPDGELIVEDRFAPVRVEPGDSIQYTRSFIYNEPHSSIMELHT
jgi:hypothetical protein